MMIYVLIVKYMYEKYLCFKNYKYFVRLSSVFLIFFLQNYIVEMYNENVIIYKYYLINFFCFLFCMGYNKYCIIYILICIKINLFF